ncbi:uncharacterized protein MONOS_16914 [Monocercomonoides exilis]|uniref:uncharacterized protein n=1 Tax=Monocercomonoides exilis TaxID=2049356 RepID=UPI00355A1121|nr:hypothetical protein MONOS_16914 [Monocercomonoides exilis]
MARGIKEETERRAFGGLLCCLGCVIWLKHDEFLFLYFLYVFCLENVEYELGLRGKEGEDEGTEMDAMLVFSRE